jgi:hypothetical protein
MKSLALLRVLTLCLFGILSAANSLADYVIFSLKAPAIYVGDSFTSSGSIYNAYGTFSIDPDGTATYPGVYIYSDDPSPWAEISIGDRVATFDSSTLNVSEGGSLWLDFHHSPGSPHYLRFLLPYDRGSHAIALAQPGPNGGAPTNTPVSPSLSFSLLDATGAWFWVYKCSTIYDPSRLYWLVDLTTRERCSINTSTYFAESWEPDPSLYPLVSITVYLEGREANHRFTVHRRIVGQEGDGMTSSISALGGSLASAPAPTGGSVYNASGNSF